MCQASCKVIQTNHVKVPIFILSEIIFSEKASLRHRQKQASVAHRKGINTVS